METPYEIELGRARSAVRFGNRRIEAEYRTHLARRSEVNVRRQLLIGLVMIVGLTVLDFSLTTGPFAVTALKIKTATMIPAIALVFALTYVPRALWMRQVAGVIAVFSVGAGSLAIAEIGEELGQPMVEAGYYIVILFTYFFIGLRYPIAVATSFALVALYVIGSTISQAITAQVTTYTAYNLFFFSGICALGAGQLELARRRDFLNNHILKYRAGIDELSGIANRRAFDTTLVEAWETAGDQRLGLVLMMIDIDHFKAYNDLYGHQAGDRAICGVASVLKRQLRRPTDFVARYGGEEFAAIVTDIDAASALKLAEKIRTEVLAEAIEHAGSTIGNTLTVSIGLAHVEPHATERSPEGLLQMADEALYTAKSQGRNRVVDAGTIKSFQGTGIFSLRNEPTTQAV